MAERLSMMMTIILMMMMMMMTISLLQPGPGARTFIRINLTRSLFSSASLYNCNVHREFNRNNRKFKILSASLVRLAHDHIQVIMDASMHML